MRPLGALRKTKHADAIGQALTLRAGGGSWSEVARVLEHRIEVPVGERGEERFIRVSFQGYNDAADLERLRSALDDLLAR